MYVQFTSCVQGDVFFNVNNTFQIENRSLKEEIDTVHGKRFLLYSTGVLILGPLIVHIFLCGPFYFLDGDTVAIKTDYNTPSSANRTKALLGNGIEHFSEVLFQCFDFNCMK